MNCVKCSAALPDGAKFCCFCGKDLEKKKSVKRRGNGSGSVYQRSNKTWVAVKTVGYTIGDDGRKHRQTISKGGFKRMTDALKALEELNPLSVEDSALEQRRAEKQKKLEITLKELYDKWLPSWRAGKSTIGNYSAAFNYFSSLWDVPINDIDIDDYQDCIDTCPRAKGTKKNMKVVIGLLYKYAVPRGYTTEKINLGEYLIYDGADGDGGRSLPAGALGQIRKQIGRVQGADLVYCHCFLGFRPSEFITLDASKYNRAEQAFVGGAKTEAGKNRTVTVAPCIQKFVAPYLENKKSGPVFCKPDGTAYTIKEYRTLFYDVLDAAGIENPVKETNGQKLHTYTPHSCRHTFATMMMRVDGADKAKLSLIGHSSEEMLRYYQDVDYQDIRKITEKISEY